MADIAEQICLAVDEIVSKRLESIKYDTTIIATIVDNKQASEYKYTCSNGSAQFIAFSKDTTYKVNDSVQVTIPNGDYDQQKIIVGKYVADDETPYIFVQPFDTIVDVTTNLISGNEKTISGSLIANDDYNKNAPDYTEFNVEVPLWSVVFKDGYYDFDRLGIQGQFRSWVKSLDPIAGDYGYRLEVLSSREEVVTSASIPELAKIYSSILNKEEYGLGGLNNIPDSWFNKVAVDLGLTVSESTKTFKQAYIQNFTEKFNEDKFSDTCKNMIYVLLYSNALLTELYLSSSDMYGNPYNFQGFFEQEKVYDISSLEGIYGLSLFFYEKSNTFYNRQGEPIPYKKPGLSKFAPNLHTKDPYVCLGYDLSNFNTEEAKLFTTDGTTYKTRDNIAVEDNRKHIRLRWIHQYENGNVGVVSEDSNLENYDIRWYRYKMGASSADEYSGVYWTRINEEAGNVFEYILNPATNTAVEQIKVIILYNNKVIRSNILTFTNEADVANQATAEIIAGLSIWCKDGSYGNYCRYGQNNQLLDSVQLNKDIQTITANTVFSFEARFADQSVLAEQYSVDTVAKPLTEAKEIIWEFPLRNSMIIIQGFNYNFDAAAEEDAAGSKYKLPGFYTDATIKVLGNSVFISRVSDEGGIINPIQDYRINKTYNASALNNSVKCTVLKNGLVYSTVKELTFGIMGTNGTDATVVIDFDNNKTALTANVADETLRVSAHLYDSSHTDVFENNNTYTCQWEWMEYDEDKSKWNPNDAVTIESRWQKNSEAKWEEIKLDIPNNVCYLSHKNILNINSQKFFLVLKVTIKGFGDYDLIAYKAIPIRATNQYRNMIGPTEIVYNTTGHPNYYKDKFTLWWCQDPSKITIYDTVMDETSISNIASNWTIYNPFGEESNLIGTISNNILKPSNVYIKNAKPYGAYCFENVVGGSTTSITWIQPFVILQNEYPSTTINKWNGKEVQIKEGYILSPAIAAGKKIEGKFHGVMMGDWADTPTADDVTKTTGVYGFNAGAMSFAFKDDGTAFIGKSNKGRIEFNGNNGVIKSAAWTEDSETGMFIDLDNGILKIQKKAGYDPVYVEAGEYQANKYYIYKIYYEEVALNTSYDDTKTYYLKALNPIYGLTQSLFDYKRSQGILHVLNPDSYKGCADENTPFDPQEQYYKYIKTEMPGLTETQFNENRTQFYTKNGESYSKVSANDVFDPQQTYYKDILTAVTVTEEEYNANKEDYFYKKSGSIVPVTTQAFHDDYQYYQEYYVAQDYNMSKVPGNWNTSTDNNLINGERYYIVKEEKHELATSTVYDPNETYYEDNNGENNRYITLSSAAVTYPLAIGLNQTDSRRKFRVAWDGTCYIEDGEFSGNINAETGTLGDLTLEGGLTVKSGGYITLGSNADINLEGGELNVYDDGDINIKGGTLYVDDNGNINIGKNGDINIDIGGEINFKGVDDDNIKKAGRIDLGKNAYISMSNGGFIELSSTGGRIQCEKSELDDFVTPGFWLDASGFHLGDADNYFYTTPSFTGFYSNGSGVKISGTGLDIYAIATLNTEGLLLPDSWNDGQGAIINMQINEGAIHFGWVENKYSTPYLRFGFGTQKSSTGYYMNDAGVIKKYTHGMWIGSYGNNAGVSSPNDDGANVCGIFCDSGQRKSGNLSKWERYPTIYRMEYIEEKDSEGKPTGNYYKVYEPARHARFA